MGYPIAWPALLMGLILLTYWIKVMLLVRATKKAAGHHANFIPEEKTGKVNRIIWIPVVGLWVFLPILAGLRILSAYWPFREQFYHPLLAWLALLIAFIAFVITWICWIKMGKSWRMGIDPNEKTQLILNGPYAYVRHPIYGLSQLMVLMTMLILPSPLMIVVGILHIVFMQWEVSREDIYLVTAHGEPYAKYQQHVGRFIPKSLKPYRP